MPDSVTAIRTSTFEGCSSLSSVSFGDESQLETIENNAFNSCVSLAEIALPENLTTIGDFSFMDCENFTSVTFRNPDGWQAGSTPLSSSDLANDITAATYLTSTYYDEIWTCS